VSRAAIAAKTETVSTGEEGLLSLPVDAHDAVGADSGKRPSTPRSEKPELLEAA
jgi:hypothetical protein